MPDDPDQPDDTAPQPRLDPQPPENPGGVDAVKDDPDDFPLEVPDPPKSAQVEDIPEELEEPERMDEAHGDNKDMPAGSEPPA